MYEERQMFLLLLFTRLTMGSRAEYQELLTAPDRTCDYSIPFKALRGNIMLAIQELLEELECRCVDQHTCT